MDSDLVEAITELVLKELAGQSVLQPAPASSSGPAVLVCPGPSAAAPEVVGALESLISRIRVLDWERAGRLLPQAPRVKSPGDWSSYQAVVLTGLDIGGLAAFSRLLTLQPPVAAGVDAVIQGCPVYVCRESLQLFERHSSRVPTGVLRVYSEHRRAVESFGVEFVGADELASRLGQSVSEPATTKSRGRDVVTREDVEAAAQRGAGCLEVAPNAIVTALARQAASELGVEVRIL